MPTYETASEDPPVTVYSSPLFTTKLWRITIAARDNFSNSDKTNIYVFGRNIKTGFPAR